MRRLQMKKTVDNMDNNDRPHGAPDHGGVPDGRKKLLWTALFIVIAAATIWVVVSHSKEFSLGLFVSYISGASKPWLCAAVLCAFGFVFFEGEAIAAICRALGCDTNHRQGFEYSAADIYFSGITPSATGGQPMCAYFMIKDGIPAGITTAALLINLTLYTMSILVISLLVAVAYPGVLMSFGVLSKVLIIAGYFIQCLLAAFFIMLLMKRSLLHGICRGSIHFLCKIKLLRHEEEKQRKLDRFIDEYAMCSQLMKSRKKAIATAFVFNILQRLSVILVPLCVFMAQGGAVSDATRLWAVQSYVVIGSNSIPIPGAMGVSDYIMLDGYGKMMDYQNAINFELLSRSISFYICIVLCGVVVLAKKLIQKKTGSKNDRIL